MQSTVTVVAESCLIFMQFKLFPVTSFNWSNLLYSSSLLKNYFSKLVCLELISKQIGLLIKKIKAKYLMILDFT